jgi:ElaB/YqjD/DUF883 family membrane-anchored ribosome-binding protein
MYCNVQNVKYHLEAVYKEIYNEAQDTDDKVVLQHIVSALEVVNDWLDNTEKPGVGDTIVTLSNSDGYVTYNYYKVIGVQNCHGAITQKTLLNTKYDFIALDEPIGMDEEFDDIFEAWDEKVMRVHKKEDKEDKEDNDND